MSNASMTTRAFLIAALVAAGCPRMVRAQPDAGVDAGTDAYSGESHFRPIDDPQPHWTGESHFRTLCIFGKPDHIDRPRFRAYLDEIEDRLAAHDLTLQVTRPKGSQNPWLHVFKGDCDALALPGRHSLPFGATLEAAGGILDFDTARRVIWALTKPEANPLMRAGDYEIAGVEAMGFRYLMTRPGLDISGRKVAVDPDDMTGLAYVKQGYGATAVPGNTQGPCAPAGNPRLAGCVAVPTDDIVPERFSARHRIGLATYQVVLRRDRFPEGLGVAMRRYQAEGLLEHIETLRARDAERFQGDTTGGPSPEQIEDRLTSTRIELRDRREYDQVAVTLLFKARCAVDQSRAECVYDPE